MFLEFVYVKKRMDLGVPTEFGGRKRFHSFQSNQMFHFEGENGVSVRNESEEGWRG